MATSTSHDAERARLAELASYQIIDSEPDSAFDAIVQAATIVAGVPAGGISLIDGARQWFKARVGMDFQDLPRGETFCRFVLEDRAPVVVSDARANPRTADSAYVTAEDGLRFYAGFPLTSPTGAVLGTLCVNDNVPHDLTPQQVQVLWTLADQAMAQIELRHQAADAVSASAEAERRAALLDAVLDAIDVGVTLADADGRLIHANAFSRMVNGIDAIDIAGMPVTEFAEHVTMTERDGVTPVAVEDRPIPKTLASDGPTDCEVVVHAHDVARVMRVHGRKLRGPAEELIGVVTASHDVTALRARESELSARVRDVEALAEASRAILGAGDAGKAACEAVQTLCGAQHVSLVVPSGDALVTVASTSANLSGFELPIDPESSVVGTAYAQRKPTFINVGSDPRTAPRAIELLRAEYGPVGSALYMPLVHEDECLGVLLMTSAHELGKLPGRIFGLLEIVTAELGTRLERDRLRSELAAQASTDPLTGLANRRSWDERVGHAVIAAGKAPLCMAILDLDHFKLFNDTHGHQAGDLLLREVAAAWSAQIRSGDLLARLGGEEFGLMLPGCTVEDAMPVLNAVRLAVPQGQTVSIGLSQRRTDETVSTWYARTDQALYRAKAMGRDRVQTDADGFVERRQHPPIPTQAEVPEPTGESRTP